MNDRTERGAFASHAFRSTRMGKGVMATVPIVLAGAMTVSMNLTGPLESASAATKRPVKAKTELAKSLREIITTAVKTSAAKSASVTSTAAAPLSYTVTAGDTVSSIAGRYGLSTASVLAANGLSWKSLIFPGQVLKLAAPVAAPAAPAAPATPAASAGAPRAATTAGRYMIQRGDTISKIAARFGLSTQALLAANGLGWSSIIYGGQTITIPAAGSTPLAIQTVSSVTPVAPAAAPTPAAPAASTRYTIRSGDTISSIATSTGVAVSAILSANGLSASSLIYAGRTLVIPGAATAPAGTSATPITDEMAANARIIIQVGRRLGVPDRGIVIALAAAAQESGMRNIDYGDRDSVGIFQQRPSTGWGSTAQLLNVDYAARLFYGGPSNPNTGRTRGLLDVPGWQGMSVAAAAQAVQVSAYPDAYANWETSAWSWLAQYR
ncbi:MAG: LysM peptidoglycan-binding domain-containing protein [Actinomycetota bacterium]|nr:LysM peptidoglycan-binding domain-containing protein [Actinomycetota bacterium]